VQQTPFPEYDVLAPEFEIAAEAKILGKLPMTRRQLATLRTLSAEAYQPKLFEKNLTAREAERRIAALKAEIELANSF
jgi:hypothetical protein